MKFKILIFIAITVFSCVFFSFRLLPSFLKKSAAPDLYYCAQMEVLTDYIPFLDIMSSCVNEMTPNQYVTNTAPTIVVKGAYGSKLTKLTPMVNNTCEFGVNSDNKTITMMWTSNVNVNGFHTEFDININTTFAGFAYWGNGNSGTYTYDRATTLKHELGHAVGLGHSDASKNLMYESKGTEEIVGIDDDAKYGYQCIYDAENCRFDESGKAGNIEISANMNIQESTSFYWQVETESMKAIKGFNVYEKDQKTNRYTLLNKEILSFKSDRKKYFFHLYADSQDVKKGAYYLEIVYANVKDMIPFEKIKKSFRMKKISYKNI